MMFSSLSHDVMTEELRLCQGPRSRSWLRTDDVVQGSGVGGFLSTAAA